LLQQLDGGRIAALREGLLAAGRIHSDRTQQIAELIGSARIKAAMGALRKLRNLAKCSRCLRIVAFLKEKDWKAEIPSGEIKISGDLLHCIANEHERANLVPSILHACMNEHSADLIMTSAAIDLLHQTSKRSSIRHPRGSAAFTESTKENQLNIEAPDRHHGLKHYVLELTGMIPCRSPTSRGIKCENQP
jgi:hypothetical protein